MHPCIFAHVTAACLLLPQATSSAYEEMQAQNQRLLVALADKEEAAVALSAEKLKAGHWLYPRVTKCFCAFGSSLIKPAACTNMNGLH